MDGTLARAVEGPSPLVSGYLKILILKETGAFFRINDELKDPKIMAPHQLLEEWAVVAPDGSELPFHDLVDQGRQV